MRKALVVGINDYASSPLSGCINDAKAIQLLLERHSSGSPNFDVHSLYSDTTTITRARLREEINSLFSGDPDVALFYFSGHGYINSFGGYIVTPDYQKYDEGVSMDDILGAANRSKAKNRVIVLDCCHSGKMGSPSISEGKFSELADGVTVLVACRENETALETGGQGVFTSLLIDALNGGSADLVGHVSPGGIYAYVDRALGPWEQRPVFKTNVSQFVSVRNVSPPIDISVLRELCTHFNEPYVEYQLDPSYEDTEADFNPDNVQIFKKLQKMERVGLVIPVGEEHMYYAAINSKTCKLTAMGVQYWKLVNSGNI
ncbi:MAG: caspase family protein [Candidatus Zixiibacteriota bacterium]